MTESTALKRGVLWLTVLALAFGVVMIGADQASAAKPEPQITLTRAEAEPNTAETGCNYRGIWTLTDVNGRFAYVAVEYQLAGSSEWLADGVVEVDLKATQSAIHTVDIIGPQPDSVTLRAAVVKKNGSAVTDYAESNTLSCALPEGIN